MNSGGLQSLLLVMMLGGMLWIVLDRAASATSNVEDIVYVITTYFIVNSYLRNIGWQIRNLQRAINELDDLVLIEETEPQVHNQPPCTRVCAGRGPSRIRFRALQIR